MKLIALYDDNNNIRKFYELHVKNIKFDSKYQFKLLTEIIKLKKLNEFDINIFFEKDINKYYELLKNCKLYDKRSIIKTLFFEDFKMFLGFIKFIDVNKWFDLFFKYSDAFHIQDNKITYRLENKIDISLYFRNISFNDLKYCSWNKFNDIENFNESINIFEIIKK